jgi:chromosome segregation ATPase
VIEAITVLLAVMLAATVITCSLYYKRITKAQKEYEKAKTAVEDIILSFNREIQREGTRIDGVAAKLDQNTAKADESLRTAEVLERKLLPIETKMALLTKMETQINSIEAKTNQFENQISTATEGNNTVLSKIAILDGKIKDAENLQEGIKTKLSNLEEQTQKIAAAPSEFRNEPVIAIRRDKALATLTETEIMVLEMLVAEGPKTAPEIKDRVKLSREHTARLMKKLYEQGYLERQTGNIPFKYSVKKEMEELLKKTQPTPT